MSKTERVTDFSLEQHAIYECCKPAGMPKPSWVRLHTFLTHPHTQLTASQHDQLSKDIRHVPDAPPASQPQSRRSSTFGIATPRRTSRSGASASQSNSQGQSTPPTNLTRSPSEPYLAICPPKLSSRDVSSKLRQERRRQHTPIPEEAPADQQTYWNEYDHPDSEFGGDDGGYVIYIDPDASVFPGQKTLTKWYGSVRRLFPHRREGKEGGDIERQNSSDTLAETAHSQLISNENSDSEDDYETSPSRKPLLHSRGNPYGAISHTTSRPTSATAPSRWTRYTHPTTSSLCLAAAVVILGIVSIMLATGRRKARQTVEVGVLVGVFAAIAFVGLAVGGMLRGGRGSVHGRGGGEQGTKGMMLKVLMKWMVAVAVCVWAGWLGAEVLL